MPTSQVFKFKDFTMKRFLKHKGFVSILQFQVFYGGKESTLTLESYSQILNIYLSIPNTLPVKIKQ